jgi:hypothetical protein
MSLLALRRPVQPRQLLMRYISEREQDHSRYQGAPHAVNDEFGTKHVGDRYSITLGQAVECPCEISECGAGCHFECSLHQRPGSGSIPTINGIATSQTELPSPRARRQPGGHSPCQISLA